VDQNNFLNNPSCHYLGKPKPPPPPPCVSFAGAWVSGDSASNGKPVEVSQMHGTDSEVVAWSNGANWTRACSNFAGRWCDYKSCPVGTSQEFLQAGCAGTVTIGGKVSFTYTFTGNVLTASKGFYNGLAGTLDLTSVGPDLLQWANGADWYRNHTSGAFRQPYM
jgi:hypothetical protein